MCSVQVVTGIVSAATGVGSIVLGFVIPQCRYVKDYKANVKCLRDMAKKLAFRKELIEANIQAAVFKDQKIRKEVDEWLALAKQKLIEYDKMEGRIKHISGCCRPWWGRRYLMSRKVEKMAARLGTIITESDNFKVDMFDPPAIPSITLIRTASDAKTKCLPSTMASLKEVMDKLRNVNVFIIGVYGMGGVGKTTMVKQVMKNVLDEKLFNYVLMVTVSQSREVRNIQGQIADKLGLDLRGKESEEGRADELMRGIMKGKKVLIVLDDVWKQLSLSSIGVPDLKSSESKILLTSRSKDVICQEMGSDEVVQLKTWSDEDSWSLMKDTTGLAFESPPNFEKVGRSVTKECGGLPIAIVAVAMALKEKDVKVWENALSKLQDNDPLIPENVYTSLRLSYDFLEHPADKEYFQMCCLFPEDHNINKEELARYGMGLGWFEGVSTMEKVRDRGNACANRLISSGLLLEGDNEGQVKMHDVLRDFAIWMTSLEHISKVRNPVMPVYAAQASRALQCWPKSKDCTAISVMFNKIQSLPNSSDSPELKVLLLQGNTSLEEIPEAFFETTKSLRVLSLSNIKVSKLPRSIGSLLNLRTLFLDHCSANEVHFIGSLENLEILSLRHCSIVELPGNMGNLKKLRFLDLAFCKRIHSIPRAVMRGLTALEELYLQGSFAKWEKEANTENGEGNACFNDVINLPYLTILKVDIEDSQCIPQNLKKCPNWKKFYICISRDSHTRELTAHTSESSSSRSLVIDTSMDNLPEWFINLVSCKAEWLMYTECENLDLVEAYHKGQLSGLESLVVELCSIEKPLIRFDDGIQRKPVFENLQKLRIHQIENHTEISYGELPEGSLEKLEFLDIHQCAYLQNTLLTSNLIKRLNNLLILKVTGAVRVTKVFGLEGLQAGTSVLKALEEVRFNGLRNLESMCNDSTAFMRFNKLKCLIVTNCKKLRNLFSESVAKSLLNLEVLWVEECAMMEEIVKDNDQITPTKIILPKLKTIALKNLTALRSFTAGNAALECPLLENIYNYNLGRSFATTDYSEFHSTKTIIVNNEQHLAFLRMKYKHLFEG